ncbi:DUF1449 family protein [Salinimonas iocasae]|uniref:DUF1449 family protein n=2 Tax=Salinimonas iocasae TaxID=2572577 RepID=A0A5B7YC40_9ALTE|nr:DUF1449 family protein [Salinimonas iocasae]
MLSLVVYLAFPMAELLYAASPLFALAIMLVVVIFAAEIIAAFYKTSVLGLYKTPDHYPLTPKKRFQPSGTITMRWFGLHHLPIMLWLAMFLSLFAIVVLSVTAVSLWLGLPPASLFILSIISVALTSFLSHFSTLWLASVLYNRADQDAVQKLTGARAVITMDAGYLAHPTEARLLTQPDEPSYLLVEPLDENDVLKTGEVVTLVRIKRGHWLVQRI